MSTIFFLRTRLAELDGPCRTLTREVMQACGVEFGETFSTVGCWRLPSSHGPGPTWVQGFPDCTGSLDAARLLIQLILPDFWITSGLCALSGHASIGPDYNGPAGERLRQEWPEAEFHAGFDADLSPGNGPHRECAALLDCLLQALERKPTGAPT